MECQNLSEQMEREGKKEECKEQKDLLSAQNTVSLAESLFCIVSIVMTSWSQETRVCSEGKSSEDTGGRLKPIYHHSAQSNILNTIA